LITGTVVNSQGLPLNGIMGANLLDDGKPTGSSLATEVVNGRFEFKMVPPGRYRLRFLLRVNGRIQSGDESVAEEIEIHDGTHVEGVLLTVH
jgi:hypothetical protein